eukprot:GCRY01000342.1.p1 GENE.GCRY01000342.1~~GCRY01000342.1.p1  ORF type:complete len:268 (+),score=25.25 GCRY01000342.1:176-979(+)
MLSTFTRGLAYRASGTARLFFSTLKNMQGKAVPDVSFMVLGEKGPSHITTEEIFKGKKVALFSLPGAFTPTCSSKHLPRFNALADVFKQNGFDDIVCVSVNDAFVMKEWGKDQEANNVRLIPDGNGTFTEKMGMLVDKSAVGMGKRSWRYSMIVSDGVVEKMFIEPEKPGDPFEVSDAETMLKYANPNVKIPGTFTLFTRPGCPHCERAITALKHHGQRYEEIQLNREVTSESLFAVSGGSTTPQVFFEGQKIGTADELESWLKTHL